MPLLLIVHMTYPAPTVIYTLSLHDALPIFVANDNRTFETLDTWGVELSAGAVSLMPDDLSYTEDDSILDLGSHREPDLEKVVERSEERRVGKEWRAAWRVSLPKRRRSFGRTE